MENNINALDLQKFYKKFCRENNLEKIKYFLDLMNEYRSRLGYSNDQYEEKAEEGFNVACICGNVEAVKFLMTSSELIYKCKKLKGFKTACSNQKWNVVEYMIFDYKMSKTAPVEEAIIEMSEENRQKVNAYFNTREIALKLEVNLPEKSQSLKNQKL